MSHRPASIKRIIIGILIGLFVIFLVPVSILLDWDSFLRRAALEETEIISDSQLKAADGPDGLIKLSKLVGSNHGTICAMYPYGFAVSSATEPVKTKINQYLKKYAIRLSEGEWAIVFVTEGYVRIDIHNVRSGIRLYSPSDLMPKEQAKLPSTFQPSECVDWDRAVLFRGTEGVDTYMLLGETNDSDSSN